jgi:Peptidase family M1 domain
MSIPGLMLVDESLLARLPDARDDFVAMVCAHEVAHLWFGCHVSMRWWDDLWLDEAMATYVSYAALAEVGAAADPWTAFCYREKPRAYLADELPGRQAVSSPVASAADALLRPAALTYSKGASVVRQLAALIGDDALRAGVTDYLRRFGGGAGDLDDLAACWSRAAGRDLSGWAVAMDVGDPLTEAVCWNAARHMVLVGELAAAGFAAGGRLAAGGAGGRRRLARPDPDDAVGARAGFGRRPRRPSGVRPVGGAANRATCSAMRPDAAAKEAAWRTALAAEPDTLAATRAELERGSLGHALRVVVSGQEAMLRSVLAARSAGRRTGRPAPLFGYSALLLLPVIHPGRRRPRGRRPSTAGARPAGRSPARAGGSRPAPPGRRRRRDARAASSPRSRTTCPPASARGS